MATIPMNRENFSRNNVGTTSKKEAKRARNGMSIFSRVIDPIMALRLTKYAIINFGMKIFFDVLS